MYSFVFLQTHWFIVSPMLKINPWPRLFFLLCSKAMEFSPFWHSSHSIFRCLQSCVKNSPLQTVPQEMIAICLFPNSALFIFYPMILNSAKDTVRADDWCQVNRQSFRNRKRTDLAMLLAKIVGVYLWTQLDPRFSQSRINKVVTNCD